MGEGSSGRSRSGRAEKALSKRAGDRRSTRRGAAKDCGSTAAAPSESPTVGTSAPPHANVPLDAMTERQLWDVCVWHADVLAALQEPRIERRTMNTFSVAVLEDAQGRRQLVVTDNGIRLQRDVAAHIESSGLSHRADVPVVVRRRPVRDENGHVVKRENGHPQMESFNADTGDTYDKSTQSGHHAEQRMLNVPTAGERIVAQSPSQPCCSRCQSALSEMGDAGDRPLDRVAPERRGA